MTQRCFNWLTRLALVLLAWNPTLALGAPCLNPTPLRLVQIPLKSAKAQASDIQPLLTYLEQQLQRPIAYFTAHSYGAVVDGLLAGSYDVAELGPAAYADAMARGAPITAFAAFAGQEGILFDTQQGYHAALIVRANSGLSLNKLKGETLALTDPDSTSGALIPEQVSPSLFGAPLTRYFGAISFLGSHAHAIEAVRQGQVSAAFVSTTQIDNAIRHRKLQPTELEVLWQSDVLPSDPVVMHQQLCPNLQAALRRAFLHATPALQFWFNAIGRPAGYRAVTDANYRAVRAAYDQQRRR